MTNGAGPIRVNGAGPRVASSKPLLPCLGLPMGDHVKTALLLGLSLVTLPISYVLAALLTVLPQSWVAFVFPFSPSTPSSALAHRAQCRADPSFRQRTVLVTGVGMTKGLTLARAFWLCGHRVVAADFDVNRCGVWTPWIKITEMSYSRAFDALYSLERPDYKPSMSEGERKAVRMGYAQAVTAIILSEGVDLWVSCSGVASALEDAFVKQTLEGLRADGKTPCRASIQFDVPSTSMLHEKWTFVERARGLGLLVPETISVSSHEEVLHALDVAAERNPDRQFILKPVGMDDAHRGNMTLLPLSTRAETEDYVEGLPLSRDRPWILQQFIRGKREYCTHALVVDGTVKVFAGCPSSELLMHYVSLAAGHAFNRAMLEFTRTMAEAEKRARPGTRFTGHLSFDFMAEAESAGEPTRLYAIECNPRAHTAVALFATPGPELRAMVGAYLSALEADRRPSRPRGAEGPTGVARPPVDAADRYWVGHDLVELVLLPAWGLARGRLSVGEVLGALGTFSGRVRTWKDGTFEIWDPWPFVALYHHYWPKAIVMAWWKGGRWSRVNVSTTKMFLC